LGPAFVEITVGDYADRVNFTQLCVVFMADNNVIYFQIRYLHQWQALWKS